jgi:hypothetical protein
MGPMAALSVGAMALVSVVAIRESARSTDVE